MSKVDIDGLTGTRSSLTRYIYLTGDRRGLIVGRLP